MFQEKVVEEIKTHILCSVNFFFLSFENRAVYDILWKNILRPGRQQLTIWRMCTACWVPKATNTHFQKMLYLLLFHYNNCCKNVP